MIDDKLYTEAVHTLVCLAVVMEISGQEAHSTSVFPEEIMSHLRLLVDHFKGHPGDPITSTQQALIKVFTDYEDFVNIK